MAPHRVQHIIWIDSEVLSEIKLLLFNFILCQINEIYEILIKFDLKT